MTALQVAQLVILGRELHEAHDRLARGDQEAQDRIDEISLELKELKASL